MNIYPDDSYHAGTMLHAFSHVPVNGDIIGWSLTTLQLDNNVTPTHIDYDNEFYLHYSHGYVMLVQLYTLVYGYFNLRTYLKTFLISVVVTLHMLQDTDCALQYFTDCSSEYLWTLAGYLPDSHVTDSGR